MKKYIIEMPKEESFKRIYLGKWELWMPNEDDFFWYINRFGNPALEQWTGHSYHLMLYKLGNCYRTEAEAKQNRDKWIDFYTSDEVMEV